MAKSRKIRNIVMAKFAMWWSQKVSQYKNGGVRTPCSLDLYSYNVVGYMLMNVHV